jgi:hypothetical protein
MIEYQLHEMYQQWIQGNENYSEDWVKFVELVARDFRIQEDEAIRRLQKYSWFVWPGH